MARLAAREGLAGMELVEVSPPDDVADITSLLAGRVNMDVLAPLDAAGTLGRPSTVQPGEPTADEVLGEDETPQEQPGG
jgi:agmatinase